MSQNATSRIFLVGAGLMLAHQVAGKAVRDGLFLSQFPSAELPKIVVSSAIVAVLLGVIFVRMLSRLGPLKLAPASIALGSMLHVLEYAMLQVDGLRATAVVVVYLHLVGFGAILLSGFWSVVNEVLGPREAKLTIGRIAATGTIGGICGGALAERGAAMFGTEALLLLLAAFHFAAALLLWGIPREDRQAAEAVVPGPVWKAARDAFRAAPFLINLAVLVMLGTVSTTLLDYLFKSGVAAHYAKGSALTRYFAMFYTVNQILSFAVQCFLTPVTLRRLGLGRTVQWHPVAVAMGASASFFLPAFATAPILRSVEIILRTSFLRSGYELFFTPVPAREKRVVKIFLDVGCDRLGDAVGAGLLQLLLILGPARVAGPILALTFVFAAVGAWITSRMDRAYAKALEHGLVSRSAALNGDEAQETPTISALFRTVSFPGLKRPSSRVVAKSREDTVLNRLADLRSGAPQRIKAALKPDQPYDGATAALAIRLLGWEEVSEWARAFLLVHAHRAVGQLVDALLDPEEDITVRRRIPALLAYTSSQRAVDGLTAALDDKHFDIRFNSTRALEFLRRMSPDLRFDSEALLSAVTRELLATRDMRSGKSIEHIFNLVTIQLPVRPAKAAIRALHGNDRQLRSLALEYLENNLSDDPASPLRSLSHLAAGSSLRGESGRS